MRMLGNREISPGMSSPKDLLYINALIETGTSACSTYLLSSYPGSPFSLWENRFKAFYA